MKKSDKLRIIAQALDYRASNGLVKIKRYELKVLISKTLGFSDTHTVNSWIMLLFAKGLISIIGEDLDKKPTRTDLYKINKKACEKVVK